MYPQTMNSLAKASSSFGEENHANKEMIAVSGVELLAAGSDGRGTEVVQILESDPELLSVGDPVGDTALHMLALAGHVEALRTVIRFLQDKHPEVLMSVVDQKNEHGKTPLQLAVDNGHKKAVLILFKRDANTKWNGSKDRRCQVNMLQRYSKYLSNMHVNNGNYQVNNGEPSPQDHKPVHSRHGFILQSESTIFVLQGLTADIDMKKFWNKNTCEIKELLKKDPTLMKCKDEMGNTVFHKAAIYNNIELLTELVQLRRRTDSLLEGNTIFHEVASSGYMTRLVQHFTTRTRMNSVDGRIQLPSLRDLLLEGNNNGNTALHMAVLNGRMKVAYYLIGVEPEAAYRVNKNGESPLFLVIMCGYNELVKYMLQNISREDTLSDARHALFTKKGSLPHAAIKARNLTALVEILEKFPELINSSDEKGWKPLSYAAYKGCSEEVDHMLIKFPESLNKFDDDGSLPIHKVISGGHITILQKFISFDREAIYKTDMKGRTVLHIAVRYMKDHILDYLAHEIDDSEKILGLKDRDGKTYIDLAKELRR